MHVHVYPCAYSTCMHMHTHGGHHRTARGAPTAQANPLHTEEQLRLYRGCSTRLADGANSALLADLMEARFVDPAHIAPLVRLVLGCAYVPPTLNDSGKVAVASTESFD